MTTNVQIEEQRNGGGDIAPPVRSRTELRLEMLPQPSVFARLRSSFTRSAILPAFDPRALRTREWRAAAILTLVGHLAFAVLIVMIGWHALMAPPESDVAEEVTYLGELQTSPKSPEPAAPDAGEAAQSGGGQKAPTPASLGVKPALAPHVVVPPSPTPPLPKSTPLVPPALPSVTPAAADEGLPGLQNAPPLAPPSPGGGVGDGIGEGKGPGVGDGKGPGGENGPGGRGSPGNPRASSNPGDPNGSQSGSAEPPKSSPPITRHARLVYKVKPEPTAAMLEAETFGTVTFWVTIGPDGRMASYTPQQQLPNGGTEAALKALARCRFEPALASGVPVQERIRVVFEFHP